MYSREQIEAVWSQFNEAQKQSTMILKSSCPTARDTQGHLGNLVTSIGADVLLDSLPAMQKMFFRLLDAPKVKKEQANDKVLSSLERLGIQQ